MGIISICNLVVLVVATVSVCQVFVAGDSGYMFCQLVDSRDQLKTIGDILLPDTTDGHQRSTHESLPTTTELPWTPETWFRSTEEFPSIKESTEFRARMAYPLWPFSLVEERNSTGNVSAPGEFNVTSPNGLNSTSIAFNATIIHRNLTSSSLRSAGNETIDGLSVSGNSTSSNANSTDEGISHNTTVALMPMVYPLHPQNLVMETGVDEQGWVMTPVVNVTKTETSGNGTLVAMSELIIYRRPHYTGEPVNNKHRYGARAHYGGGHMHKMAKVNVAGPTESGMQKSISNVNRYDSL